MNGQPNTKVLFALAGVVIIVLIVIMAFSLTSFFGGDEADPNDIATQNERFEPTTITLGEGEEPLPIPEDDAPATQQDPREAELEALVESFTDQPPSSYGGSQATDVPANDVGYSIDSLYAAGFQPESAPVNQGPIVPPPTYEPPQYTYIDDGAADYSYEVEELDRTRFSDCGEIEVPSGALSQYTLMNTLDEQSAVQCLGRAVSRNCTPSEVEVTPDETGGSVYVVKDNDDQCAVGFRTSDTDIITLCDLETILEAQGEDKDWDEWEDDFGSNPGVMMADVVVDNMQYLLGLTGVSGAGCRDYEI